MAQIAAENSEQLILTSDNPRSEDPAQIIKDILSGIKDQSHTRAMVDRAFAIQEALKELEEDEVLMILGKGDEDYIEINGKKSHFDDREVVRLLLEKIKK